MPKMDGNQRVKEYSKPTLTVYGKVTELTTSVGKTMAADGGVGASMNKTAI